MQNFTGVSRRQRQVNLSGKSSSLASRPGHLGVSGATSVAHAREVRAQRENERRRNKAATLLQSTLRGYLTRKTLYAQMRSSWDSTNRFRDNGKATIPLSLEKRLDSLALLLIFWDVYNEDDQKRLVQTTLDLSPELAGGMGDRMKVLLARFSRRIIFRFLTGAYASQFRNEADAIRVLEFLSKATLDIQNKFPDIVRKEYYQVVSRFVQLVSDRLARGTRLKSSVLEALLNPMYSANAPSDSSCKISSKTRLASDASDGFVFGALSQPYFLERLDLDEYSIVSYRLDVFRLSEVVLASNLPELDIEEAEWILAHLIHLNTKQTSPSTNGNSDDSASRNRNLTCIACIGKLLQRCSSDILARWNLDSSEASDSSSYRFQKQKDAARKRQARSNALPSFIKDELRRVQSQSTINTLMTFLNKVDMRNSVDAVAHFVAALLTTFPDSRAELQRWLHLSRTAEGETALQFFWKYVSKTPSFLKCKNVDTTLQSLRTYWQRPFITRSARDDWIVIIAFLTMIEFSFLVLDDEQFFKFSGSSGHSLELSDLKELCSCLKHIGFVSYWNEKDVVEDFQSGDSFSSASYEQFLAIRELVVKILRILHHRDSRRRFLPQGHWLMTAEIDMTSIIPQVVAEEEAKMQASEADSDDSDDEDMKAQTTIGRHRTPQRILSAVTPRLAILEHLPFLIPFNTRLLVFREFVRNDRRRRLGVADSDSWMVQLSGRNPLEVSKHQAVVQRGAVFDDAYNALYGLGEGLKDPIQVSFVDAFGELEAGIDGGGVTKEFLTEITKEAFGGAEENSSLHGTQLFVPTENHALYPNPTIFEGLPDSDVTELLKRYEFLGRIVGKALYEEILLEVNFAPFFLLKFPQGNEELGGVDDLRDLDEGLWNSLQKIKYYDDETLKELSLTFTTDVSVPVGPAVKVVTKELKENGYNIAVTSANRLEYLHRLARFKLVLRSRLQTNAFIKGLSALISRRWLSMFNQSELQRLIGGDDKLLDLQDWKDNTVYGGVYDEQHPTIKLFWEVMGELDDSQRRLVLKFVTSVSRAPLLGFGALSPKFAIRDAGSDPTRLISASTCVSLLKLPMYRDKRTLRDKLLYAVNYGAGFDLS